MNQNIGENCACGSVNPDDIFKLYSALFWFGIAGPENIETMKALVQKALGIETDN